MEILKYEKHRPARGHPLKERAPSSEQLVRWHARPDAEKLQERGFDPVPIGVGTKVRVEHRGDPGARCGLVVGFRQTGADADHLAKRPERDALAVRRGATLMPPHALGDSVEVLLEFPGEPTLADTTGPDDRHVSDSTIAARVVEQVLEEAQILIATDERRFERISPAASAAFGDHAHGAPRRDWCDLALEKLVARGLEYDCLRRGSEGRLANQHGPGRSDRLQSSCSVDEIAGNHALIDGAERHRGLAGQDATSCLDPSAEDPYGVHQFQARAHGPLRVVFARGRRPPDRHHRVADELLNSAAVAADHVARKVEVAREDITDVLRVALFREGGETDQVGKEHRDEATLGHGG